MPDYKMANMKMDKSEAEAHMPTAVADSPEYPYGLRLELTEEAIGKLGLNSLPKVGSKMAINARVEVSSASQYDSKEGGKRRSISLQITDLGLGPDVEAKNPEEALYGK